MIGVRIIYPNSLDHSLRQDVVEVRCVWATCSSCVPAQKDIRYSGNIALVKIWTRDKIKPKHVQRELREPALDILWNVYRTLFWLLDLQLKQSSIRITSLTCPL